MVQQAAHGPMPSAGPLCGPNDRSCSSQQQLAAAWAWFEHSGATCITPRRAEGIRGAPHLRTTARPASRFKKELLASSDQLSRSDMGDAPDSSTSPAARQPRRHSFHGESVRENSSITVRPPSPPVGAFLDGKQHADVDDILGLNGDDHDGFDRVGSTLLDNFELESVWRQVRHRTVNGVSASREESTYSPSQRLHFDGHDESPDNASIFTSKWGGFMRRGGSGHFHRPPSHGRSPSKDDHQHGGTAPSFLHQLIRLGISKSASSPVLCSSIATANSIRDHRMRAHSSDRAKAKHQAKLQSLSSPQNPDARMRSLVRLEQLMDGSAEEELDQHHYHNHRHIHHHHHHHHHRLLHHTGDGVLLKHIRSKDGTNGTPMLSQKLHESLEKELLKHPHRYIERNGGGCPQYGYREKNEGKANEYLQPPQLDYRGPLPFSCKSSSKSHHALL